MTSWTLRFGPDDRAEAVYRYVPFDPPPAGFRVGLAASGGVVDLGLVDGLGWRGWSGAARATVLIGPAGATPGYVDRGLPDGPWQVVLGLHRVPAGGVTVHLDVTPLDVAVPAPAVAPVRERPPRRVLPAPAGLAWYAGDLHSHSEHSDGAHPLDVLAALGAAAGLDFLAVTDHNTVSHHPLLAASGARHGLTLLPGQEVTTSDGHANAVGDVGWVDMRAPASAWVRDVAARGGLLSVNHPLAGDCAWRHPLPEPPGRPPLAEVWHGSWTDRRDAGPVAWWAAAGGVAVGGSDLHRDGDGRRLGAPTTWVAAASPAVPDLLAGLAAGRVSVGAGPWDPVLLRVGDELVAVDADATVLVCPSRARRPVRGATARFAGHHGPHLLETSDGAVVSIANAGAAGP